MVVTGGDIPIECKGPGGKGIGRGDGEGKRRDGALGDDGFGTEDRGYNVAH